MAKFCANCGSPLNEGEKFCGSCGAKVEDFVPAGQTEQTVQTAQATQEQENNNVQAEQAVNNTAEQPVQENVNNQPVQDNQSVFANPVKPAGNGAAGVWIKNHKTPLIIAAAAIVAVVAAVIILVNIFKYQVIDPKDIAAVKFYGVNSAGSAAVTLDERSTMRTYYLKQSSDDKNAFDYDFYKDNISNLKAEDCSDYLNSELSKSEMLEVWTKASNKSEANRMRNAIMDKVTFELDKTDGLSNGDKVKVKVKYSKENLKKKNIKLSSDEFEVEVKGLKKAEKVDLFKDVSLECKGYNGCARAVNLNNRYNSTISINKADAPEFIDYSFSDETSDYNSIKRYSNDDEIEVTASVKSYDLHKIKNGYWLKYEDKYYIVPKDSDTKKFKVSGLKEPAEIDVFKDVKFDYSGVAPHITMYGANLSEDSDCTDCINFTAENKTDLKVNDKFKVYARVNIYDLADKGYKPSEEENSTAENFYGDSYSYYSDDDNDQYKYFEKEFTVDDTFAYYITKAEDAKAAENELADKFTEEVESLSDKSYVSLYKTTDDYDFCDVKKMGKFKYVSSVLCTAKSKNADTDNYVVRIYSTTFKDDKNKTHNCYVGVFLSNVVKKDGSYDTNYGYVSTSFCKSVNLVYSKAKKISNDSYNLVKYKNSK